MRLAVEEASFDFTGHCVARYAQDVKVMRRLTYQEGK
jgi:hypothetical protein